MAALTITLEAETDLIQDAIGDIQWIFSLLARRHGEQFRELERRIERLMEGQLEMSPPRAEPLGDCRWIFLPPPELTAIIRDAKALGVI